MVRSVLFVFAAVFLATALPAVGATTGFIKIDGVEGESEDAAHKGEIEILSWSWGVSQTSSVSSGQATGRRTYEPIVIRKRIDKATPMLAKRCADGVHIKDAKITLRRQGATGEQDDYLVIELKEVFVTSISMGCCDNDCDDANPDLEPSERVSITYKSIKITHVRSGQEYEGVWSPRSN